MNPLDALSLIALVVLAILLVLLLLRRIRTVDEGYVAVVQFLDRYSRIVGSGPYFLWPLQEEIARVNIRRREVTGLEIGGIFTHGGLPISVILAYEMRLDPGRMDIDELYYDDRARDDQQIRIFKQILQELITDTPPPAPQNDENKVDFGMLFSPFMGTQSRQIRNQLEQKAIGEMIRHGVELMVGTLIISRLKIPDAIISAYTELISSGFSSAARHQFIDRVRNAGMGMSDSGLVQLVNAIQENPGNIHSIFSTGAVQPDVRVQDDTVSVRMSASSSAATGTNGPAVAPSQKSSPPSPVNPPSNDDLPLTEEDMAMLRSLFD